MRYLYLYVCFQNADGTYNFDIENVKHTETGEKVNIKTDKGSQVH